MMRIPAAAVAAWTSIALVASAAVASPPPRSSTKDRILKLDRAWEDAEGRGDAAFVDQLLLPEYRSIGPDGKVVTKQDIVRHTRTRRSSADYQAKVAAWKSQHPLRGDVKIVGTTAILTWVSTRSGGGDPVSSCDIFVRKDGRWHALYSQHSVVAT